MAEEHQKVVRPAGAPMVPSPEGGPAAAEVPERSGGIAAVGTTAVDEAKEAGAQAVSDVGSRAREELDRRSTQAGGRITKRPCAA